ncbi:mucin-2 [Streptomyces sp. BPTC-684]|uniref:mucin-2 n=1 Tax=Streptomyces sp. BPTC-684 TaxID=3043734 RepID=UPI0024B13412|nr:mucin-2 [Streptomyces sp. BPTC-684]WHM36292.1 mucin-2 [Streptomyces sp. BPTC-684]
MSWFKVDDTAHAHPKLLRAGNAALGLWMRAGAYAAQHLTEGAIPGVVAQLYGTAPQVRKLITAGLWHEHGHKCPRCPQPPAGDYVMHDYLIYNPTRARVEDERAKAAGRQKRARERASEQRSQERNPRDSSANRLRTNGDPSAENLESSANRIEFPDDIAGQGHMSQREGDNPSRSPRPDPSPTTSFGGSTPPSPQGGQQAPAAELFTAWWTRFGRGTAQGRTSVRRAIEDALGNGIEPRELWAALDRLGATSKPVTGGTLQFALADLRKTTTPGAAVIPLAAGARRGQVARAADLFAAALANTPQEHAR